VSTWPSSDALWASVSATVRELVLPELTDEFARLAAIQLVGLAEYARARGPDPADERRRDLSACLDALAANALVAAHWPGRSIESACSAVLVDALEHPGADADEVKVRLRPLLVAHLDADLAGNAVLFGAFRGALPGG